MTSHSDLNALAARVHEANARWWHDPRTGEPIERNVGEMCMLMISELSEAMEGARKDLMDDHLPHRRMEEVEMADCLIRVLDFAAGLGVDIPSPLYTPSMSANTGESLLSICHHIIKVAASAEFDRAMLPPNIAQVINKIMIHCSRRNLDIWGAFEDKMAYNATRHDHTNEARLAPGGKKW